MSNTFSPTSLKAIAALQVMEVPPPSYSTIVEDDSDGDDTSMWGPPIKIHIDASITVEGTGNTAILSHVPSTATLAAAASGRNVTHSTTVASSVPQADCANRNHADQLVRTVLSALQSSNVLSDAANELRRPLDLHINAATKVGGERNQLFSGNARKKGDTDEKAMRKEASGLGSSMGSQSTASSMGAGSSVAAGLSRQGPGPASRPDGPSDSSGQASTPLRKSDAGSDSLMPESGEGKRTADGDALEDKPSKQARR